MPKAITSLEGFIRKLANLHEANPGIQLLFRGHSKKTYGLSPSIFRNENHIKSEHLMIRQLVAQHPSDFAQDRWIFDQLVRAQHYGLPTRLLDVTLNPLVALYFAVASQPGSRGSVVIFKPEVGRQKYYDSDAVSCLSALALMTYSEKESMRVDASDVLKNHTDKKNRALDSVLLEKFNNIEVVQKLIQLVRQEKPDFRPIIQPIDLARPIAVVPKKMHARILAQNGSFILFGLARKPNTANMAHIEHEEIDIDQSSKTKFLKELSAVGITESSMFPEIERAALAIKGRYA